MSNKITCELCMTVAWRVRRRRRNSWQKSTCNLWGSHASPSNRPCAALLNCAQPVSFFWTMECFHFLCNSLFLFCARLLPDRPQGWCSGLCLWVSCLRAAAVPTLCNKQTLWGCVLAAYKVVIFAVAYKVTDSGRGFLLRNTKFICSFSRAAACLSEDYCLSPVDRTMKKVQVL